MSVDKKVTKENMDLYLTELAKKFKQLTHRKGRAEVIIAGGGAILLNHHFRDVTEDIDAVILADSAIKDAILYTREKYNLSPGWINSDFCYTPSYSDKLREISEHYRLFANVLEVRTVPDAYLIAMKLVSGRDYKHDLSDIIGILKENSENGSPLSAEEVDHAVNQLYGGWDRVPEHLRDFFAETMKNEEYEALFEKVKENEFESQKLLDDFSEQYPNTLDRSNVNEILALLRERDAHR